MKFKFNERKADIADDIREYTRKKVGKLDKYLKQEGDAQVTFGKNGIKALVEVTVVSDGLTLRATTSADDFYNAVDGCIAGMERQIHKNKTRLAKRLHEKAFVREVPPVVDEIEIDEEIDFPVIRSKRFAVKPMTTEEAILQMNLIEHEFFVFKNIDEKESFSVVYRRKDGGYGLIAGE
jgi:putative sigma-54 modulation protein